MIWPMVSSLKQKILNSNPSLHLICVYWILPWTLRRRQTSWGNLRSNSTPCVKVLICTGPTRQSQPEPSNFMRRPVPSSTTFFLLATLFVIITAHWHICLLTSLYLQDRKVKKLTLTSSKRILMYGTCHELFFNDKNLLALVNWSCGHTAA